MVLADHFVFHSDHQALHQVGEFADVSGPGVLAEQGQGLLGYAFTLAVLLVETVEEEEQKRREISCTLPERRDKDVKDIKSEIEVLAEGAGVCHAFQIAV